MKKNIVIIILISASLFFVGGCEKFPFGGDFLEKAPGTDVTIDTIFNKMEYAQRYLFGAYNNLRYGVPAGQGLGNENNVMGRDLLASVTDESHSYLKDGVATRFYYTGLYNASLEVGAGRDQGSGSKYNFIHEGSWRSIRICYNFLANIDRVPDGDADQKKKLKAEAYGLIAAFYAEMFRNFGGLPWIDRAYDPNSIPGPGSFARLTAQATCDSIVKLCDRAITDLPFAYRGEDLVNNDGRLTGGAMMGIKARALLFNASPVFNDNAPYLDGEAAQNKVVWHGAYNAERWKSAMDAAHALIVQGEATGDYGIYRKAGNSYRKDFLEAYFIRGNGELLLSTRKFFRSPTATNNWQYGLVPQNLYRYASGNPTGCLTMELVDAFPMLNGKPISDPTSGYNPNDPYKNRDWRLLETVVCNGDVYKGRTAETYIGGRERLSESVNPTGNFLRKFLLEGNTATSLGAITSWPYLRMAEIYLSYAEASNEYKGAPDAEAYRCVNIVRNRVGLPDLTPGMTREQFREAVINERLCELAMEEVRWFDMVRWKRENDFRKTLHGIKIIRSATTPYTYTAEKYPLPTRFWQENWSPKWYFCAIPLSEIQMGNGLIQNPGWE